MGMVLQEVRHGEATLKALLDRCTHEMTIEARSESLQVWRKCELQGDIEASLPSVEVLDERELSSRKAQKSSAGGVDGQSVDVQAHPSTRVEWQLSDTDITTNGNTAVEASQPAADSLQPTRNATISEVQMADVIDGSTVTEGPAYHSKMRPVAEVLRADQSNMEIPTVIGNIDLDKPTPGRHQNSTSPRLPNDAWQLVDIYFTYTHPWFPVMDRSITMESLSSHNRPESGNSIRASGEDAALWAIMAYTSRQSSSTVANSFVTTSTTFSDKRPATEYYNIAKGMIYEAAPKFQLAHARALLLLGLIDLGEDRAEDAWVALGLAARIVVINGHSANNSTVLPSIHKHTLLGCFVLDTIMSARLQKCPQLRTSDFERIGSIDETGLEEWNFWRAIPSFNASLETAGGAQHQSARAYTTFNHTCKLMSVLNDETVALDTNSTSILHRDLAQSLQEWKRQLPSFCEFTMGGSHERLSTLPHVVYLQMWYCALVLIFHDCSSDPSSSLPDLLPERNAVENKLISLLEGYLQHYGSHTVPATFVIFIGLLSRSSRTMHNPISASSDKSYASSQAIETIATSVKDVWSGAAMFCSSQAFVPTTQSNIPRLDSSPAKEHMPLLYTSRLPTPTAEHLQQPRLLQEFLHLDELEADGVVTSQTTSTQDNQRTLSRQEGSHVAGSGPPAVSNALLWENTQDAYDVDLTLDEATFQSMLLEYGSQR